MRFKATLPLKSFVMPCKALYNESHNIKIQKTGAEVSFFAKATPRF
jgi:hypothetical protein